MTTNKAKEIVQDYLEQQDKEDVIEICLDHINGTETKNFANQIKFMYEDECPECNNVENECTC